MPKKESQRADCPFAALIWAQLPRTRGASYAHAPAYANQFFYYHHPKKKKKKLLKMILNAGDDDDSEWATDSVAPFLRSFRHSTRSLR